MRWFPLFSFHLPPHLRDTRQLSECERYDLLSRSIPEFMLSLANPLIWQNELRFPYIRERMGTLRGKLFADVGCGWGFLLKKLAESGAVTVGLDISEATLKLAKCETSKAELQVSYLRGEAEFLPLKSGFDSIVATDVLEHVSDLEAVISEVALVLKPGGKFFFVTVNKTLLARLVYITFGEILLRLLPRGTHRYAKFIAPRDLQELLEKYDLVVEDLRGILVNPFLRRYHFWSSRAIEYIGVARKQEK